MPLYRPALVIFLGVACLLHAQNAVEKPAVSLQKQTTSPVQSDAKRLREVIASLKPRDLVLEIGGETATWRELYPHIQGAVKKLNDKTAKDSDKAAGMILQVMQSLVSRRMFAMEAQKQNLVPTQDERKAVEAEIEKNLAAQGGARRLTLEQYAESFDLREPNLLNVTYDDVINIMFLNHKLFEKLEATDEEIDLYIRYKQAVRNGLLKINDQRKKAMENIAKLPQLKTDDGFKAIVREYSEGVEAAWGGELKYDFTREELAEINQLKSFDWKVGEVTPVLETNTAFRIMKVLRSIPAEKPGEPEKLRMAQILCGKIGDDENLSNRDALKSKLTMMKQKDKIEEYTYKLSLEYAVTTPLFPQGLWQKPEEAQLPKPRKKADEGKNSPANEPSDKAPAEAKENK